MAHEGGRVAVLDLREDAASALAQECGGDARTYGCDVADPKAVAAAFEAIDSDLGPVEVLVCAAGIATRRQEVQDRMLEQLEASLSGGERDSLRATSTLEDERWDRTIRVHLYGTFHCCREGLRRMEDERAGAIVNLASILGLQGADDHQLHQGPVARGRRRGHPRQRRRARLRAHTHDRREHRSAAHAGRAGPDAARHDDRARGDRSPDLPPGLR
jgi:3-oxoacyl-[acyl-carrier protein] reductase